MPAKRYGTVHQRLRKSWKARVEAGQAFCGRCGRPVLPGSSWHLDHEDLRGGEGVYRVNPVSHAKCNVRAAAKLGGKMKPRRRLRRPSSRKW
jgi:hypothetical protein